LLITTSPPYDAVCDPGARADPSFIDHSPMARYESSLIYQFADRLYGRASSTIVAYTALFALIGFSAGLIYAGATVGLIAAVLLGAIGYVFGSEKAFQLKLQAQTALCQVQIEENTRTR
jgi:hypothetical protein